LTLQSGDWKLSVATMDNSKCHIVYVSPIAGQDRRLSRYAVVDDLFTGAVQNNGVLIVKNNLKALLELNDGLSATQNAARIFDANERGPVHMCASGTSCIATILELHDTSLLDLRPTIVLVDTPHDERIPELRPRSRSASPHSRSPPPELEVQTPDEDEVYGLRLLQRIVTEAHMRSLSKLVVPISVISCPLEESTLQELESADDSVASSTDARRRYPPDHRLVRRCVDLGAVDVVISPMNTRCVMSLEVHAYKAHKDAAREQQAMLEIRRGRKLSWVGVSEEKPFGYLREAMVSGLMKGICRLGGDGDDRIGNAKVSVPRERKQAISAAIARWHFCAHDFSDDELLIAALMMFRHALSVPELEKWRIHKGEEGSVVSFSLKLWLTSDVI
jgi:hypothetical protein